MNAYTSRPMARVETRNVPEGDQTIVLDAPIDLSPDQCCLWRELAPRLAATGRLNRSNRHMFRMFVSLAASYLFLRRRALRIDPAFEHEVIRQAERFGLTTDDLNRCVVPLPCAQGVH